jgi:hypothetical protein
MPNYIISATKQPFQQYGNIGVSFSGTIRNWLDGLTTNPTAPNLIPIEQ